MSFLKKIVCCGLLILFCVVLCFAAENHPQWHEFIAKTKEEIVDNPAVAYFKLGVAYANLGDFEQMTARFQKIADLEGAEEVLDQYQDQLEEKWTANPKDLFLTAQLALMHFSNQEMIAAEYYFERLCALDPFNIWPYNYLAMTKMFLEDNDSAHEILDQSLSLAENNYTRAIKGMLYWQEGRRLRAMGQFARTGALLFQIREFLN